MGVLDSGVEPDKLLALFGTDPVHLTETGYKAISTALGDELDTPHVVHVRSLTAATPAPGRNTRGQRPPPRESWTAGTEVVAHRNTNWSEKGGPGRSRRGGRQQPLRPQRCHDRPRGSQRGRWTRKRSGYKPY